jgi:hypothetical protein
MGIFHAGVGRWGAESNKNTNSSVMPDNLLWKLSKNVENSKITPTLGVVFDSFYKQEIWIESW